MTLTPQDARLALALMGHGESPIRPGAMTAQDALKLLTSLRNHAEGKET